MPEVLPRHPRYFPMNRSTLAGSNRPTTWTTPKLAMTNNLMQAINVNFSIEASHSASFDWLLDDIFHQLILLFVPDVDFMIFNDKASRSLQLDDCQVYLTRLRQRQCLNFLSIFKQCRWAVAWISKLFLTQQINQCHSTSTSTSTSTSIFTRWSHACLAPLTVNGPPCN